MVVAHDSSATAFRAAEKYYQLHKEQQIRISKGRKHGGKLVIVPTDFSDVLDLRLPHSNNEPEVKRSYSATLGKSVFSLTQHPGCHIIPGHLDSTQQKQLFNQALTVFPAPPNRSNLTLQHGHLPSLWAAAQQGLFLWPLDTGDNKEPIDADEPSSTVCSDSSQPARHHPIATCAAASNSTTASDVYDANCKAVPCHEHDETSSSSETCTATAQHHSSHASSSTCAPSQQATRNSSSQDVSHDYTAHLPCQHPVALSSRWSSDPVGASAASLLQKLRWVALGPQFNWSTRQYEDEPGVKPLPPQLARVAQQVVKACEELLPASESCKDETIRNAKEVHIGHDRRTDASGCPDQAEDCRTKTSRHDRMVTAVEAHGCVPYEPNTALVNFYREGDTLGGHKDDAELHDTCPIVSLSLGCDGVFLMGGQTKDVAPAAVWLRSGDAVVMSGPARQCYHGVPRVMPGQLASELDTADMPGKDAIFDHMQRIRVNISIRQT